MDVSLIFNETLELVKTGTRRVVHQGGQSSGKTVNILMALATIASQKQYVITITSMSFPHLRSGAMRDFERWCIPAFAECITQYRKTDHVVLFDSGSIIEFKTYESEYDARGAKRDILYVNEANTFDWMTFFQLDSRSNISIIDYNPTIRFWAHEKVMNEAGTAVRISDHRHNPFLTKDKHREIEKICTFNEAGNELIRQGKIPPKECVTKGDYELWKVYARGLTGNVTGLIYPDWVLIDEHTFDNFFFAIDFGYENDPTAVVKIEKKHESIYVEELAYQTGSMTAREIRSLVNAYGMDDEGIMYCEHDPDMIKQLKLLEVRAVAARKGQGSIRAGISKLREYKVFYIGKNIKKETKMYIWETNDEGNATNKPIDANNHLMDAIRYGVYSHFYKGQNEENE